MKAESSSRDPLSHVAAYSTLSGHCVGRHYVPTVLTRKYTCDSKI